jgi:hypothetical protein
MEGGTLIALILATGTAISGLITAIFHSASLSRCKKVICCCFECDREVLSEDVYRQEQQHIRENNNNNT